MADFCVQCSADIGAPPDYTDFEKPPVGYIQHVLCEGCGQTAINSEGQCISKYCLKQHGDGHWKQREEP